MAAEMKVPDAVAKAAEEVRVRSLNAIAAYGSAGVEERHMMAMRAALEAALATMLEPVGCMSPSDVDDVIDGAAPMKIWSLGIIDDEDTTLYRIKPE